jgi:predicted O-linked N-acetylglucosamine transferase (SPINDLY family)
MDAVDFLISDPVHSPPDDRQRFVERVVRLPTLRYCWEPPSYAPAVRSPPACAGAAPVFGSFNRLAKLSAATVDSWCALLTQVPEARLMIKNTALAGEPERAYVRAWFERRGVDPARVSLRGGSAHATMLAEYLDIDIALDTFPYNGGLTTLEALWMGRPVITLQGESMIGRQSRAILSAIGLAELCAADAPGYVALAASLVQDRPRLAALSAGLRQRLRDSSVMDIPGFTRSLEALYRQEWRRWCASASPSAT